MSTESFQLLVGTLKKKSHDGYSSRILWGTSVDHHHGYSHVLFFFKKKTPYCSQLFLPWATAISRRTSGVMR